MRSVGRASGVFLAALLGVLVGAAVVLVVAPRAPRSAAPGVKQAAAVPSTGKPVVSAGTEDAITSAVKTVGPAVVNINTLFAPPQEDRLQRMMRQQFGLPREPFPRAGQGSGIIIDKRNGYVLTNAHVVKGAQRVRVLLADGRQFEAKVVGLDPLTEVAVVKVPGDNLPEATLGSADKLPIGAWVIAIGNPFGFENSVTVGVLSAKGREIAGPNKMVLQDLLQTDASINPGNSGGALVDVTGKVVGIPTAVIPYAQGIGFAVSIDVAKQVAQRLIETGKMPWLGIQHRALLPEEAKQKDLPVGKGTMVFGVVPGGPADKAGIKQGDLVLQVGKDKIDSEHPLGRVIRSYNAGQGVEITVVRKGKEMKVAVTLGAVPEQLPGG